MLYTLEAVKANIRNREGRRVFILAEKDRITPEARDYLTREKIPILPPSEAKPQRWKLLTGGYLEEKPEAMTHLNGDTLVEKTHPRIAFRGGLDALEAELLLCALEIPRLQRELEEILELTRKILQAEVLEQPLETGKLLNLTEEELRRHSHFPQDYYAQPHFMPAVADGRSILHLNRLRCVVRQAERLAVAALPERQDILRAMNRMSSAVYLLMLREKAKQTR